MLTQPGGGPPRPWPSPAAPGAGGAWRGAAAAAACRRRLRARRRSRARRLAGSEPSPVPAAGRPLVRRPRPWVLSSSSFRGARSPPRLVLALARLAARVLSVVVVVGMTEFPATAAVATAAGRRRLVRRDGRAAPRPGDDPGDDSLSARARTGESIRPPPEGVRRRRPAPRCPPDGGEGVVWASEAMAAAFSDGPIPGLPPPAGPPPPPLCDRRSARRVRFASRSP